MAASTSSVTKFPPNSCASLVGVRSEAKVDLASATIGPTRSPMRVRSRGTATATTAPTATSAANTPSAVGIHSSLELVDVRSRWRSTCPIPTTSVRNNSEIWMRNPLKLSIAATDIAVGAVMPWR